MGMSTYLYRATLFFFKMLENGHYYKQRDNSHIAGDVGLLDSPKTIGNSQVKGEYIKVIYSLVYSVFIRN